MKISRVSFSLFGSFVLSLLLSGHFVFATVSTVDPIPHKVTGDTISADDVNNIVGVLKGVTHDDKNTIGDFTDDEIFIPGFLCDTNGCLGDSTIGPWTSIADTAIDSDTAPDGLYYGSDSNGDRIGIGTNDPMGILHLDRQNAEGPLVVSKGSYGWTPGVSEDFVIGDGVSYWGIDAGTDFRLGRAGLTHLYISNTGKVGIGEIFPSADLHISNNTGSAVVKINSANNQNARLSFSENATEKWNMGNDTTNDAFNIYNPITGNTDLSIDQATGNIGINKTGATEKLEVDGNILVTTGNDICLSNGRCLSQNNGSGTTQHEGWPDAIQCDINNPDWGLASFYLTYTPVSNTYWKWSDRNIFVYRLHHADRISIKFNMDKTFNGYENISVTDCGGMTIPELYEAGKAFNFLSMPVCNNLQTLKFNDTTNAWECADTSSTLPYCIEGQTLKFDATNSQWICASNENLPTCAENQLLDYNTGTTAWECTDGIDAVFPTCADNQILSYDAAMLAWVCQNESGGAGTTLPTCSEGMVAVYEDATNTWVCGDKRPTCTDSQILAYNGSISDWECTDNTASMPVCLDGQILSFDETDLEWECANNIAGGGSGTDENILALYKHTTQMLSSTYEPITFDTQIRTDSAFTHSTVSSPSEITIEEDGWYELKYHMSTDVGPEAGRSGSSVKIEINLGGFWGELPGTLTHMDNLSDLVGGTNTSASVWHEFSAGDKIRLIARQDSGDSLTITLPDAVSFTLRKEGGLGGAVAIGDSDWSINGDNLRAGVTGNVGIGVVNPLSKLSVDGGIQFGDDSDVCDFTKAGTTRFNSDKLQLCTNDVWTDVGSGGGGKFVDGDDPLEAVYITGNVGIGTTDPEISLQVGDSTGKQAIRIYGADDEQIGITVGHDYTSRWNIFRENNAGNNNLVFYEDHTGEGGVAASRMVIEKGTGNVGIGVIASPTEKLDVDGNIKASGTICDGTGSCVGGSGAGNLFIEEDNINRSFSTTWADGMTLRNRTIRDGWDVRLHYELPARNDSTSWGGGYTEVQYRVNSGTWHSIGQSGYQIAMGYSAKEIRTDTRTMYLQRAEISDAPVTGDFDIQFKFRHRSYDGTLYINQSRGTANSKFASLFEVEEKKFSY